MKLRGVGSAICTSALPRACVCCTLGSARRRPFEAAQTCCAPTRLMKGVVGLPQTVFQAETPYPRKIIRTSGPSCHNMVRNNARPVRRSVPGAAPPAISYCHGDSRTCRVGSRQQLDSHTPSVPICLDRGRRGPAAVSERRQAGARHVVGAVVAGVLRHPAMCFAS